MGEQPANPTQFAVHFCPILVHLWGWLAKERKANNKIMHQSKAKQCPIT